MVLLYDLGIWLYGIGIRLAALRSHKAKQWVHGRATQQWSNTMRPMHGNIVWMHCASLGEYEQGVPILRDLREFHVDAWIVCSFFSPSGFDHADTEGLVDELLYLPLDTHANALGFIEALNPSIAIFVKYEFWYHHLKALSDRNVPTFLVSGMIRKHPFLAWYGGLHRRMLSYFSHLFVQTKDSAAVLTKLSLSNFTISGDSRVQRVRQIAAEHFRDERLESFVSSHKKIIVCGSTWPPDEILLQKLHLMLPDFAFILAPHEVNAVTCGALGKAFPIAQHYSTYDVAIQTNVLIVDTIGLLKYLYRYGQYAYIGGGFGVGIHNLLEAAVYGVPLFCGPKVHKFQEAIDLLETGDLKIVTDTEDMCNKILKAQQLETPKSTYINRDNENYLKMVSVLSSHLAK
jgi:3-deoxy-D-manno-octulosonic-acid transferase